MYKEYKSRLSEVEEKKSVKSAIIFGSLTILVIILVIFFGLQIFSRFVGLFNKPAGNTQTKQNILVSPALASLPQYTNKQAIIVKATATPNSDIKIFFNNSSDVTVSDTNGDFALNISLSKGTNTIFAKVIDKTGNSSESSNVFTVNYTTQVPNLTINVPQNNQNFYGSTQKSLDVQGSTDPSNTLTINDHVAVLDGAGKFSYVIDLQSGDNNLKIISTDLAGNKKEIDLKVTFAP